MANDRNWGGKRAGAGRKPGKRPKSVPHRKRPIASEWPLRLSLTLRDDIDMSVVPEIVRREVERMYEEEERFRENGGPHRTPASNARVRHRKIHFEVFGSVLTCAETVQLFAMRVARRINSVLGRKGKVFRERYRVHSKPYVPPPPPTLAERIKERAKELALAGLLLAVGGAEVTVTRRRGRW